MPTCGLYCSTAIGRKKQRIKIQCMFPVEIGERTEEIVFFIIPNLAVDLIIGCDSFMNWEALIDFGKNILQLNDERGTEIAPFINEEGRIETSDVTTQKNMLEETFFVESISVSSVQVVKVQPIVGSGNETTSCIKKQQGCEDCIEYVNENNARWLKTDQNKYIEECIRLCRVNMSIERSYEEVMRQKVNESENLRQEQKNKLFGIMTKNRRVFSEKLGRCNSYIHRFEVTDRSPFNHKCRTIPTALIDKIDGAIQQMLEDGVIEKSNS